MTAWMRAFSGKDFLIYMWEEKPTASPDKVKAAHWSRRHYLWELYALMRDLCPPLNSRHLCGSEYCSRNCTNTHTPALAPALTSLQKEDIFHPERFGGCRDAKTDSISWSHLTAPGSRCLSRRDITSSQQSEEENGKMSGEDGSRCRKISFLPPSAADRVPKRSEI